MKRFAAAFFFLFVFVTAADATDRFYPDIHVHSASGRYRVDATSPDNEGEGYSPFQEDFTYTCTDTTDGKVIWTRKQAAKKQLEASPISIFVQNDGSAAVFTGWNNLIIVSSRGQDLGKINLLKDALTETENDQFVHRTTAGPRWTGLSARYFLTTANRDFFVLRPWWGRRIFVDISKGKLVEATADLTKAAIESEKKLVIKILSQKKEPSQHGLSRDGAAYLAGVLKLKKSIPMLRALEKSTEFDSSTMGGLSLGDDYDNEVDPHSYETNSLRQLAQLSLRRIGEKPDETLPMSYF